MQEQTRPKAYGEPHDFQTDLRCKKCGLHFDDAIGVGPDIIVSVGSQLMWASQYRELIASLPPSPANEDHHA